MSEAPLKIVECPRDAMQGLHEFIPTEEKVRYINSLLEVGFDTIDFGSFVSPAAIPQMRDTAEVLAQLDLSKAKSKLLAIVANTRGAKEALLHREIAYLGFPLSLSQTFQQRNTNKTIAEAFQTVQEVQDECLGKGAILVVYLSMGFGNPYGDPYESQYIIDFVGRLDKLGIKIISPSDTVGVSTPESITSLFQTIIPAFPHIEFGAHLHSTPGAVQDKLEAAYNAGCRRFDGAIRGFGGCPMAADDLVGNMATEKMITYFKSLGYLQEIHLEEFKRAYKIAEEVFPK